MNIPADVQFLETGEHIIAYWETPYGKQSFDVNSRILFVDPKTHSIKVSFNSELSRRVNPNTLTFMIRDHEFELTNAEKMNYFLLKEKAMVQREVAKEERRTLREQERKEKRAYLESAEYKEMQVHRLLNEFNRCKEREKEIKRQLHLLGIDTFEL